VQEVGRELGVRYVLEGSVRRVGDRVRITAQLVDAGTGRHVWAERYDRRLDDVFALQDEITRSIVGELAVTLDQRGPRPRGRRPTDNPETYDTLLRGLDHLRQATHGSNLEARRLFGRVLELAPDYAEAHALRAHTYFRDWSLGWGEDWGALDRALEFARRAVALDPSLALAHRTMAIVLLWKKEHQQALEGAERAVGLAPSDADAHWTVAEILSWWRPEEAIAPVQKGMRLDPRYPPLYLYTLGHAYYLTRRYEDAVETLERATRRNPDWLPARALLAATCAECGRLEDARAAGRDVVRMNPRFAAGDYKDRLPYKDPATRARVVEALRTAGLAGS
jgi:adenylate cyclase